LDVIGGVVSLIAVIIVSFFARSFIVSSMVRRNRMIYKNLKVVSDGNTSPGVMVYVISIITAIIGPFSFRIYPVNTQTYIVLNAVAAVIFVAFYPRFAPITGFATVDVIDKNGKMFCVVGKIMNRTFRVAGLSERPKFEIVIENGRNKITLEVTSPSASQK
jgi:hypothetical protein